MTALAGGVALAAGIGGRPPVEWLDNVPVVSSWVVPGLVLALGFGLGSLLTMYGVLARPRWTWTSWVERPTGHHWSWIATMLIGWGHAAWIGLELIYLPEPSWLQVVYGPVGLALALLPLLPSLRTWLARSG